MYMYIYMCVYAYLLKVLEALLIYDYLGRSKCEASAGHGVVLY